MARSPGQQFCAIRRDDKTLLRPRQQARRRKKRYARESRDTDPPSPPSFSLLHPPAPEPSLPDLVFLFSTNYFSTPRGYLKIKKLLRTFSMEIRMAPGVGFEPTRPEGHRLTGEPIPDMGPRARQTARYQAPESRLNWATFHRLFSLLESAPEDANSKNPIFETRTKIALGGRKHDVS